jgi:hypothetical protein
VEAGGVIVGAVERARDLVRMCDGIDVLGGPGRRPLTGLARQVARDLVETLDMLEAERSARRPLQVRCETQQEILGKAAYRACVEKARW